MRVEDRWLLPEGVGEILPPHADRLETLRRAIVDLFQGWGYELCVPPLIEYLESLLTGTGRDLDLETFKITDQMTGRLMGVRADMTPQVARIDAHRLKREVPTRLCYLGPVLHTLPAALGGTRNPLQIGAELYGHRGVESDVEVLCLMVETLKTAGQERICVDLGHMRVFRELVARVELDRQQSAVLFDALQRKSGPEIAHHLRRWRVPEAISRSIAALPELNGDAGVLDEARVVLSGREVLAAVEELRAIGAELGTRHPEVRVHFDLAELRGYHYHTGVMFAAYTAGQGQALAKGGRYDDIGAVFGRARPATGFSTDLKLLVGSASEPAGPSRVFAPSSGDERLRELVAGLRGEGRRVVCGLPGQVGGAAEMGCGEQLALSDGQWVLVPI
jgi:ATP phosphoribosyltransferase regulatory subunit